MQHFDPGLFNSDQILATIAGFDAFELLGMSALNKIKEMKTSSGSIEGIHTNISDYAKLGMFPEKWKISAVTPVLKVHVTKKYETYHC